MRRVAANFVTPSRPGRWHWALVALMAACAIGFCAQAWHTYSALTSAQSKLQSVQAQLQSANQLPTSTPTPPYESSAREMLRERDPLWVELLTALEAVAMPGISIAGIQMTVGGPASIQLTGSDYRTVLEYLAELNGPSPEPGALRFDLQQARYEMPNGQLSVSMLVTRVPSR